MFNIEKYADEIKEIFNAGELAVSKSGKPVVCFEINCQDCFFDKRICNEQLVDWLISEYQEKPEITEAEYYFCKILENGGLFKDGGGDVHWTSDDHRDGYYVEPAVEVLYAFDDNLEFNYLKTGRENATSIQELIEIYEASHDIKR